MILPLHCGGKIVLLVLVLQNARCEITTFVNARDAAKGRQSEDYVYCTDYPNHPIAIAGGSLPPLLGWVLMVDVSRLARDISPS